MKDLRGDGYSGTRIQRYRVLKRYDSKPIRVSEKRKWSVGMVVAAIALACVAGYATLDIAHVETIEPTLSLAVTKRQTIANTWDEDTHRMLVPDYEDPWPSAQTSVHTAIPFCQCFVVAFENETVDSLVNAVFTMPVEWFGISPASNQSVPISVYSVLGNWTAWTNDTQEDITWASVLDDSPSVDRNALDTVWVNCETFGIGTETEGDISFNVTRAFDNELWKPEYGLLVSLIAPWETTEYDWFDRNITVHFTVMEGAILVGVTEPIPEFGELLVPTVGLVLIVYILRRRNEREDI